MLVSSIELTFGKRLTYSTHGMNNDDPLRYYFTAGFSLITCSPNVREDSSFFFFYHHYYLLIFSSFFSKVVY